MAKQRRARGKPDRKKIRTVHTEKIKPTPLEIQAAESVYIEALISQGMSRAEMVAEMVVRWNVSKAWAIERLHKVFADLREVDEGLFDIGQRKALIRARLEAGYAQEARRASGRAKEGEENVPPSYRSSHSRNALQYLKTLIDLDGLAAPRKIEMKGEVSHAHIHAEVREVLDAKHRGKLPGVINVKVEED